MYTLDSENIVLPTREVFNLLVEAKFVLQVSVIITRDKLAKLRQKASVAAYVSDFRNLVTNIPGTSESKILAGFCECLKAHILLEVRKVNPSNFESVASIAVNVDGAFFGAGFSTGRVSFSNDRNSFGPIPMDIGNLARSPNGKR